MAKVINRHLLLNIPVAVIVLLLQFDSFIFDGVFGIFPLFPLALTVALSMFASELGAFLCGTVIGAFVDSSSGAHFSFNTVFYSLIAVTVSLLVHYLFNNNVRACVVLSFFSALILSSLRFIVSYYTVGFNNMFKHFLNGIVPSALITAIAAVLLYYIEKKIFKASR